nr:hypothetical protein [Streptomyces sp. NRRL S-244]
MWTAGSGNHDWIRKRFGSQTFSGTAVPANSTMVSAHVAMWLGKIFSRRRRQNPVIVSFGLADQVSTNPLSTKKNETPIQPALLNSQRKPSATPSSANGFIEMKIREAWKKKTRAAAMNRSPVSEGSLGLAGGARLLDMGLAGSLVRWTRFRRPTRRWRSRRRRPSGGGGRHARSG